MKTLHIFGCSLSSPQQSYLYDKLSDYIKFHNGNLPKIWCEILSDKMGYQLDNYSEPSSGNDSIFHKYIDSIDNFKSGDVVIIGWSGLSRFRWVVGNRWVKKTPSMGVGGDQYILQSTVDEIFINKSLKLREYEIYDYEKIILELNSFKRVETYFWSTDENVINNLPDNLRITKKYLIGDLIDKSIHPSILSLIYGYSNCTIFDETNGLVNDNHFSEKGHKILSELFYQHIIKYKNNE